MPPTQEQRTTTQDTIRVPFTPPRLRRAPTNKQWQPLIWLSSAWISLSAFTASWTGLDIVGVTIVDIALLGAVAFSFLSWASGGRKIRMRMWMFLPSIGALLVWILGALVDQESVNDFDYVIRIGLGTSLIAVLIHSEGATLSVPKLFQLLRWWALGVVVNATVVVLTNLGLLSLDNLVNNETGTLRAIGLAFHPNSLAYSLSIALPTLILLWSRSYGGRLARFAWLGGFFLCLNALYLADSRAGLIVGTGAGLVGLFLALRSIGARLLALPFVVLAGMTLIYYGAPLLASTRFANGAGAASDNARATYNFAALETFAAHPLIGSGFGAMTGVAIPLQLLSSGGLILLVLYTVFIAAPTLEFFQKPMNALSNYGILSVGSIVGFGLLNSALTERVTYWAPLILGFIITHHNDARMVPLNAPSNKTAFILQDHKPIDGAIQRGACSNGAAGIDRP